MSRHPESRTSRILMWINLLRVLRSALAQGWDPVAVQAVLLGPVRSKDGRVAAWCHRCDREIPREQWIAGPTEDEDVVVLVCPHCLTDTTI